MNKFKKTIIKRQQTKQQVSMSSTAILSSFVLVILATTTTTTLNIITPTSASLHNTLINSHQTISTTTTSTLQIPNSNQLDINTNREQHQHIINNNSHSSSHNSLQHSSNQQDSTSSTGECDAQHLCENGGTCIGGANNFTCACLEGFTGPYCGQDVNECARRPHVCKNGATCLNKFGGFQCQCVNGWTGHDCSENVDDCSNAACEAGATCHDRTGGFYCECPPGKTGLLCQHKDGCFQNPCQLNATCDTSPIDGSAICTCPPGFSGEYCSIDNDECAVGSPCEHGGLCVNTPGSFRCDCPRGFSGSRCEININECENNPCMNDGTCLDERGGFRCICPRGYTGLRCEAVINNCASNPCQNGAVCQSSTEGYNCLCEAGYWGRLCEHPFLSTGNPWSKCPDPIYCWTAFKNGKCDSPCNTAECLYDGNDCQPQIDTQQQYISSKVSSKRCDDKSDSYCLQNYANGKCDLECYSAECGWDGSDCEQADDIFTTNKLAQGLLVIRVEPAITIPQNLGTSPNIEVAKLLRRLSVETKTILKIQNFRSVEQGTEIELIADNRRCQSQCFNNTELIAAFMNALRTLTKDLTSNNATNSDALIVTDIHVRDQTQSQLKIYSSGSAIYFIVCGTLVIAAASLMVITLGGKQKVKEKATIWFPEGFKPVLSTRNKDPTNRKGNRNVSTLQALGGQFFRGIKRNERHISTDPSGYQSTEVDRCTSTPNGSGIYHEPYDQYDQYGAYITNTENGSMVDEPMTPPPMPVDPINTLGPNGLTPLMVVSMAPPKFKDPRDLINYGTTGEIDVSAGNKVTDLLQRGAQLNVVSKVMEETALHLAARHKRVDTARSLLERCDSQDVNAHDGTGRTPLHTAIAADSLGVFELLIRCRGTDLNAQTHDGTTPLILATKVGTYSMIEELIQNECEVTKSDNNGKTALHWAAATNNVDAINLLLKQRETNKDAQDNHEETPIFLAAKEGAKGAVELLLNHNANKEIRDHVDMSPIEIARSRQHYDIVRILEQHEPVTPRSIHSLHHSSRQLSPFSPLADSNSNSSSGVPQPCYHSHSQSNSGRHGNRQAQKAALARSNSTKPLDTEANAFRTNLQQQSNCKSVMVIKSESRDQNDCSMNPRESKTLGRRATQSTSSSHQAIQPNMHMNQFAAMSTNVIMPATPNSLTNCTSPISMMSPPTNSLHHLNSPTKSVPPSIPNQLPFNRSQQPQNNHTNQPTSASYHECQQTYWTNNNNIVEKTNGISEVYNVPGLKNYMTPSPDSPYNDSIPSPPGVYHNQQYQQPNHQMSATQTGVII